MNMPANIDPALLELFRAEMDAHIPVLSQGLLELEKGRAGEPEIAGMMRAAHSIKGAARIVGLDAVVRLAHVMEDCFTAAKEARIHLTSEAVDVLLQGVDTLQRLCSPQPDSDLSEQLLVSLQERLAAARDGRLPASAATAQPPTSEAVNTLPSLAPAPSSAASCLTLPADLTDAAADVLQGQLSALVEKGTPEICLDFAQVRRLTTRAMAVLASFTRELARTGPAPVVTVKGLADPLATLMRVSGIDRVWVSPG
jgi:chemotaxis protein histidine kinase CheA